MEKIFFNLLHFKRKMFLFVPILFLLIFLNFKSTVFAACDTHKVCTAFNTCTTISGLNYQPPGPPGPGYCPACSINGNCTENNYFFPGVGGLPNKFWGIVTNCGSPAPAGSYVDAKVCNGNMARSYFFGACGAGFPAGSTCYSVNVPGNTECSISRTGGENGDPVNFWVNGRPASPGWSTTFTFGANTRWDVNYCVATPTPTPRPTSTPTTRPTSTPTPRLTSTPTPTSTSTPRPTSTPTPTATPTPTCAPLDPSQPQLSYPPDKTILGVTNTITLKWLPLVSWGTGCPASNNRYKVYITKNPANAQNGDLSDDSSTMACNYPEGTLECTVPNLHIIN